MTPRNHRLAATEGIRERPGGDLLPGEVGRDVEIGGAEKPQAPTIAEAISKFIDDAKAQNAHKPQRRRDDTVLALRSALQRAVDSHLLADVETGVFLSSGLDSTVLAALGAVTRGSALRTVSIGFDEPALDESSAAAEIAKLLGTNHHEIRVTQSAIAEVMAGKMTPLSAMTSWQSAEPRYSTQRHASSGLGLPGQMASESPLNTEARCPDGPIGVGATWVSTQAACTARRKHVPHAVADDANLSDLPLP